MTQQQTFFDFENSVHTATNPMPEDELALTRQGFTSSKDWGLHVQSNLDYLDVKEQISLCLKENKEKRRIACIAGAIWMSRWRKEDITRQATRNYCKQPECPVCQEIKKNKTFERLTELDGMPVVVVQPEDLKTFCKDLSKEDYYRIPHDDGSFTFVLNKDHPDSVPLSYELKQQLAQALAQSTVSARPSGKLGKAAAPIKEETIEEEEEFVFKMEYDVKSVSAEIIFKDESSIKTNHALDKAIYERIANTIENKYGNAFNYSPKNHSWLMDELNRLTEVICKENSIEYKVLSIETVLVDADKVQWEQFKKRLGEASPTPPL